MSPKFTGDKSIDYYSSCNLFDRVVDKYVKFISVSGCLVFKFFDGVETKSTFLFLTFEYLEILRNSFSYVYIYKPRASRSESSEIYFIAKMKLF